MISKAAKQCGRVLEPQVSLTHGRYSLPSRPSISGTVLVIVASLLLLCRAFGGDDFTKDQPNSADHPALKRMEGSIIVFFEKQAFNEQCIALERVTFDYDGQKFRPFKQEIVEGPQSRILYRSPKNASTLEVVRQYQADLKSNGFENLFEGKGGPDSAIDDGYDRFLKQVYQNHGLPERLYGVLSLNQDYRYAALRKSSDTGSMLRNDLCRREYRVS